MAALSAAPRTTVYSRQQDKGNETGTEKGKKTRSFGTYTPPRDDTEVVAAMPVFDAVCAWLLTLRFQLRTVDYLLRG